ncbi:MAG: HlyC/CorC family transporter [Myxococcaceae bacterium]|nr:HlyC/CorC family transporter [Myxococcaceae bacterium]MCA3015879.1 HlyC/CorC family transporter [Myxococcaceae bacterium]
MPTWAMWLVLALLLTVRGLLAAVEAALQALSEDEVKALAKESPRRGARLLLLKGDVEATAAAIRSAMVLLGFTAAAIGVLVPPRLLDVAFRRALETSEWVLLAAPLVSALLVALIATVLDVSFRSFAIQRPQPWALGFSWLATLVAMVMRPFVKVLLVPVNLVLGVFKAKVTFVAPPPPLEELEKQLIRQAQNEEVDRGAPQLIRSIFRLSDKTCRDVMVARTEVVAIEASTPMDEIFQLIAEQGHSRIPVYRDSIDGIVGILHVRDIVPLMQNPQLIVLQDLLRPAVYVPWVKPIGDLLREMQKQRIHMAVVVDEYGGFSGIVTLEDILREIVGDIGDEFDEAASPFEKQPDGSVLVDATIERGEFAKAFDFKFPEGEFETLGGFVAHLAGVIPEAGDRFSHGGFTFVVHSKNGPRLERIKVWRPKAPSTSQGNLPPAGASQGTLQPVPERRPSRETERSTPARG